MVPFTVVAVLCISGCAQPATTPRADPAGSTSAEPTSDISAAAAVAAEEVPGCYPGCSTYERVTPGAIAAGEYNSEWFFAGKLALSLGDGWSGIEDSTGELKLVPPGGQDYGMSFWLDHFVVEDGKALSGLTAAEWIGWHVDHPQLVVSQPASVMLGDIPATEIDVGLSSDPANAVAECPGGQCADLWGYEHFDHYNGIAGDDVYRLFAADVEYGGVTHLFGLIVEAQDADDLTARMTTIDSVLETLKVAATIPD
jgi:hypothetical protein